MNENIVKRRLSMVKKRSMGLTLADTVKELHSEYKVSKTWLYADWRSRDQWLPYILDLKDAERNYWDCLAFHKQIRDWAVIQYLKADNSSASIGALNLLRGLNQDFMNMLSPGDRSDPTRNINISAWKLGETEVLIKGLGLGDKHPAPS